VGGVASPSDLDVFRTPVMDGYEATRRIKATVRGRATVIIALTASVFEEQRSVILSEVRRLCAQALLRGGDISMRYPSIWARGSCMSRTLLSRQTFPLRRG